MRPIIEILFNLAWLIFDLIWLMSVADIKHVLIGHFYGKILHYCPRLRRVRYC